MICQDCDRDLTRQFHGPGCATPRRGMLRGLFGELSANPTMRVRLDGEDYHVESVTLAPDDDQLQLRVVKASPVPAAMLDLAREGLAAYTVVGD